MMVQKQQQQLDNPLAGGGRGAEEEEEEAGAGQPRLASSALGTNNGVRQPTTTWLTHEERATRLAEEREAGAPPDLYLGAGEAKG
jgi:hypothetical protein